MCGQTETLSDVDVVGGIREDEPDALARGTANSLGNASALLEEPPRYGFGFRLATQRNHGRLYYEVFRGLTAPPARPPN